MERELKEKLPGGRFVGTTPERSRAMRAIKGSNNRTTELRFRLALVRSGVRDWKVRPKGVSGNPDFWFERQRVAVFVDGCFWHGCPDCHRVPKSNIDFWVAKIARNKQKDATTTLRLEEDGITVVRFWEHELKKGIKDCIAKVIILLQTHA